MFLRLSALIGLSAGLALTVAAQEAIELDQTLSGNLAEGDAATDQGQFQDTFTFNANSGQQVTIHVHSDEVDTILSATDATGQTVENDDFGSTRDSEVTLTAAGDGPITINVHAYQPNTPGAYVISVRDAGNASGLRGMEQTDSQMLGLGQTIPGRLEPGDGQLNSGEYRDAFYFEGQAGQPVTIDMQSTQIDPYLILMPPTSAQIDNDDRAGGNGDRNSQISITLPDTGQYTILATSYAPGEQGAYSVALTPGLSANPTPSGLAAQATPISVGQPVAGDLAQGDGQLRSGEFSDTYEFQSNGSPFQVSLQSTALDSYLILIDPSGQQQDNDDASSGTHDAQIVVNTAQPGTYRVICTSYAVGEQGAYQLYVGPSGYYAPTQPVTQGIQPVPPNQPVTPTYPVQPTQPIVQPTQPIAQPVVPPPPAYPTQPPPPAAAVLNLDQPAPSDLANGDATLQSGEFVDWFTFNGQAGQQVTFTMESPTLDTYLIVMAPSGQQQDNDDVTPGNTNSLVTMTLPETGTYQIGATSYAPGMTGAYTIGVRTGVAQVAGIQPSTPTVSPTRTYYGVFAGISDYLPLGPGGSDLPLCASDATKLRDTMVNNGVMQPDNIITLTDGQATRQGIMDAFGQMAQRVDDDDVFVFFYSGHGGQNRPNPDNTEADQCDETIYLADGQEITDDEMAGLFDQIPAEISVICLDSCFSGGFSKDVIVRPHRMGLFSSEEDLTSAVAGKFEAAATLSYFFMEGVGGQADNDPSDQTITVGELCQYLQTMFAQNVQAEESSTMRDTRGYQHLVVDRGGVKLEDILIAH